MSGDLDDYKILSGDYVVISGITISFSGDYVLVSGDLADYKIVSGDFATLSGDWAAFEDQTGAGGTGADITPLEFEAIFDSDYRTYTELLSWSGNGELEAKDYYTSGDTGAKIYEVSYNWTTGLITQKTISGISNTMAIYYLWDAQENLVQKNRTFI